MLCVLVFLGAVAPLPSVRGGEELSPEIELPPVLVRSFREVSAASDTRIRARDFLYLPRQTPSDLLRLVPGIHVQQHTGGGKAHQMFLRGFDAEHGQDLAGYLDGVPLNEVSQVHGQGYLDLHFLIPEVIGHMHVIKGGYAASQGNFSTAGSVDFQPEYGGVGNLFGWSVGSFHSVRQLAAFTGHGEDSTWVGAADHSLTEGFTDPGAMRSFRGFLSASFEPDDETVLRGFLSHYNGFYDASDVLPLDWIEEGRVGRFKSMDDTDGGESVREMASATFERKLGTLSCMAQLWGAYKKTDLFSNYTYYLFDPVNGDQQGLFDERYFGGFNASLAHAWEGRAASLHSRVGLNARLDSILLSQACTRDREALDRIYRYEIREGALGLFLEEAAGFSFWFKIVAGLRADFELYDVRGTQDATTFDIYTNTYVLEEEAPREVRAVLSSLHPKISLVLTPYDGGRGFVNRIRFFANFGTGALPPRAQAMANYPEQSMPESMSSEAALQVKLMRGRLDLRAVAWWADKDAELVFEPESGLSTDRGASRRYGFELESRFEALSWLYMAADLYLTRAFFRDSELAVPGTPEIMFTGQLSARHSSGFQGILRCRAMGRRPLAEGVFSRPWVLFDLTAGYEAGDRWRFEVGVENLFDAEWDDTSFFYETRPDPDGPSAQRKHITPGTPFSVKVKWTVYY